MASVQSANTVSSDLLTQMNGAKSSASTAAEAQDRFMTLLVTQMRNQDPLNPMDNAQVTSQLAQLSTVTGIDKLNTTLQALESSYQTSQALQATDMIGHGVLVPGSAVNLSEGAAVFGVEMAEAADKVHVTITNAAGVPVRTLDIGAQPVGTHPLTWDGKTDGGADVPDGAYKFEVTAARGDVAVRTTALSFGQVASVTTNAQGVKVALPGIGEVAFADIRQIY